MENPTLPTNWLAALSNANHVRKQKIGQNSLTSLRPAPSAADFRSCQGLFRGTFCNFMASKVTFETKNGEMGRLRWKSGS